MRILNLKDAAKQYSKFSLPGFRSGSIVKKIIALMYYFSVVFIFVSSVIMTLSADISSIADVVLSIVLIFIMFLILAAPVVIIGFSDYYDWRGIKLFLIIMISWCVLFTVANYVSSCFSDEYIKSTKPSKSNSEISSDADVQSDSSETKIDSDIIVDIIDEEDSKSTSSGE